MAYLQLAKALFDRELTLRQAYELLERFVSQYHARGEPSTGNLLSDISLCTDGTSGDPAQIYDFVRVAGTLRSRIQRAGMKEENACHP